jgi:hypothetical protein
MNVEPDDAVRFAQLQLLPLFDDLERILRRDHDAEASAFFGEIRRWIERAVRAEDLMGPFMQLATTAFRGFDFEPDGHMTVDRILEAAQTLSFTLSADRKISH